jgi:hypothetical protein
MVDRRLKVEVVRPEPWFLPDGRQQCQGSTASGGDRREAAAGGRLDLAGPELAGGDPVLTAQFHHRYPDLVLFEGR